MSGMPPDDRKMRELILFVAQESVDDPRMGATKLNKALYHIDFAAYRDFGHSITGQPYRRLSQGPVPRYLLKFRDQLIAQGAAHVEQKGVGMPNPMEVIVADRESDVSVFTAEEVALVRRVLAGMKHKSGDVLSRESHELIGWIAAEDGEDIPYETAFLVPPDQTAVDRAREVARQHDWGS